ncbi:MAG: AbrB/MazE/SpoVT family DNA-binding domain-containing protein [Gammaproteobacteria bacterium]
MTTKVKVRKVGNSCGVTLPRDALARLGAEIGDELFIIETANGVELTRFDPAFEEALQAGRGFMHRYPNAMKKLAE